MADTDSPDEMQERLDELGETIDASRRQAEADDLLPGREGVGRGDPLFDAFNPPDPEDVPDRPDSDDDEG